jgi:hypothetical protein
MAFWKVRAGLRNPALPDASMHGGEVIGEHGASWEYSLYWAPPNW